MERRKSPGCLFGKVRALEKPGKQGAARESRVSQVALAQASAVARGDSSPTEKTHGEREVNQPQVRVTGFSASGIGRAVPRLFFYCSPLLSFCCPSLFRSRWLSGRRACNRFNERLSQIPLST